MLEVTIHSCWRGGAISRQEHIALKSAANYWQTAHRKAVDRFKWRELRYQRILRELKASGPKSNASFQAELELAKGQIRDRLLKNQFSWLREMSDDAYQPGIHKYPLGTERLKKPTLVRGADGGTS